MRRGLMICSIIFAVIIVLIYVYESSWIVYNIQKKQMDSLELIKFYSSKSFSDDVKVESIEFKPDSGYFGDEALKAILSVPIGEIDNLFSTKTRDYDKSHSIFERGSENIEFSCVIMSSVKKIAIHTQRTIRFTIMKPEKEYAKVYVSIDKLGWK